MKRFLLPLLLVAGAATAQSPAPAPQPKQEEPPRRLNLSIDGIDSGPRGHLRFGPSESEKDSGGLPSLGADAREMPKTPSTGARTSPYPPDTNPGR
jgi:hypothetical protein